MKYNQVVDEIINLVKNVSFAKAGIYLEEALNGCSQEDILAHLDYGGVIPESFHHDSTEEKIFAKYCDALLARGLAELGLVTHVFESRGESADVGAEHPEGDYDLVGDAKAFRLSRTAKNQKDFKIEALNEWRHGADYAVLLAPIYQYPNKKSQIYGQAIRYNVTLLSYTHLAFMIRSKNATPDNFLELLKVGNKLKDKVIVSGKKIEGNAADYWAAIHETVLEITGLTNEDWEKALEANLARLKEQANSEAAFWEERKKSYAGIDHETAIKLLIKALKIDSKIATIKKTGKLLKPEAEVVPDEAVPAEFAAEFKNALDEE